MGERIRISTGEVWLDDEISIVRVRTKPGTYTLADAKEQIAAVVKVSGGKRLPLFVDSGNNYIEHDARDYFGSEESRAAWRAVALLSSTPMAAATNVMWTAAYDHPDAPSRVYYSEDAAIEWLKTFSHQ